MKIKICFLIMIMCISLLSCKTNRKENRKSFINSSKIGNKFEIVIWEDNKNPDFDYINSLSLIELEKKYKIILTIYDNDVISYYWDEQVIKIKTTEKSMEIMGELGLSLNNNFFSLILNNKILYNGIISKLSPMSTIIEFIPTLMLPLYLHDISEINYGKDINILRIHPYYDILKARFKDYKEIEKNKILIPELYNYFKSQNKIIYGDFPFDEQNYESKRQ